MLVGALLTCFFRGTVCAVGVCHIFQDTFNVVFAPFEADHQLVSLQRAGIIDMIISEDGDLTHLGAWTGSVLPTTSCVAPLDTTTARPRSICAALLGTDYNHNLDLVNWNTVDATTEKLVLGLR
jgi:hypothetical protein